MPPPGGCAMPTSSAPPARLRLRSLRPAQDHAGPPQAPRSCRHSLPRSLPACLLRRLEPLGQGRCRQGLEGWIEGWGERFRSLGWPASSGTPACLPKAASRTSTTTTTSTTNDIQGLQGVPEERRAQGSRARLTSLKQLKQRLKAGLPGPLPRCGKPVRLRGVRPSLVFGCALPARRTGLASGIARTQCRSQDRAAVE